jgi:PEP-CTERM motif
VRGHPPIQCCARPSEEAPWPGSAGDKQKGRAGFLFALGAPALYPAGASRPSRAALGSPVCSSHAVQDAVSWLQTGLNGGIAGDANFDGTVNGLDIAAIASNWLTTSAGGSGAAVPEPATIILAGLGAIALSRRVRDAKRHLFGNP